MTLPPRRKTIVIFDTVARVSLFKVICDLQDLCGAVPDDHAGNHGIFRGYAWHTEVSLSDSTIWHPLSAIVGIGYLCWTVNLTHCKASAVSFATCISLKLVGLTNSSLTA